MKNFLKKSLVFLIILSMAVTSCVAFAEEESEPEKLYEKFGYNEKFEYKDEYIAHALKSSVVLIFLEYKATIEYDQVSVDIEGTKAKFEADYAELSEYYTEEEFADMVVNDMIENIADYLEWGGTKTVPVEAAWRGSGVVIDESGYVATNSHVVSLTEEDKHMACGDYLYAGIMEDLDQIVEDLMEYDIPVSYDQADAIYWAALDEVMATAEITNEENILSVCFPSSTGDTALDEDRIYEAELLENGVSLTVSNDGTTQDAAILKIDKEDLVALKLSDSYPEVNSKIVSAGFPAAADAIFAYDVGSDKSILSVTVGSGNIARLIPIDGHKYKALEITTTISGGNSGGPSVDTNLNVEGLNTYGTADSLYAYMVPAEYVKELAEDYDVSQGDVTLTFLTGLQMLQQGYGAAALECFEEVEKLNGDVPYINHLISKAKDAPQEYPEGINASKTDDETKKDSGIDFKLIAIIGGAVLAVVIIVVAIILVIKSKKKKASATYDVPETYDIPAFGGGMPPADPNPYGSVPPMQNQGGFGSEPPMQGQGGFGSEPPMQGQGGFGYEPPMQNRGEYTAPPSNIAPEAQNDFNGFNQYTPNGSYESTPPTPPSGSVYGGGYTSAPTVIGEPKPNTTPGKFVGKFNFGGTTPGFINNNKEEDK